MSLLWFFKLSFHCIYIIKTVPLHTVHCTDYWENNGDISPANNTKGHLNWHTVSENRRHLQAVSCVHIWLRSINRATLLDNFYIRGSVRRNFRLKKSEMQQYADIYLLLNYSTCFGRPSHPSSGVHKTVVAATGTDHTVWEASFFKRDQICRVI